VVLSMWLYRDWAYGGWEWVGDERGGGGGWGVAYIAR